MTTPPVNIISIQSHVAYGHVGNSAAVFPLQRLGCEVWPIHTVQFSNHLAYDSFEGQVFGAELIDAVASGIAARGALARCDGVLSGYMGSAAIGAAILRTVALAKAANPDATYCCDPVIGDIGIGVYVKPGLPEFIRDHALPTADIITPNHFELDRLTGMATSTLAMTLEAIDALHARGPRIVLVTSLTTQDTPDGAIDLIASDGRSKWRVRTPRLSQTFTGAGDVTAALFLAQWLRTHSAPEALARAAASVFGLLQRTAAAGEVELALVAAQDEFVAPSRTFEPEAL
jgi:pyridoxine kinase